MTPEKVKEITDRLHRVNQAVGNLYILSDDDLTYLQSSIKSIQKQRAFEAEEKRNQLAYEKSLDEVVNILLTEQGDPILTYQFNVRPDISDYIRIDQRKQTALDTLAKLRDLGGVTKVDFDSYSYTIHKGKRFGWDEILPKVVEVLGGK